MRSLGLTHVGSAPAGEASGAMKATRPNFAQCWAAFASSLMTIKLTASVQAAVGSLAGLCQKSSGWWNSTVGRSPGLYTRMQRGLSMIGTQTLNCGFTLKG